MRFGRLFTQWCFGGLKTQTFGFKVKVSENYSNRLCKLQTCEAVNAVTYAHVYSGFLYRHVHLVRVLCKKKCV